MHKILVASASAFALIIGAEATLAQQGAPGAMRGQGSMMQEQNRSGQSDDGRSGYGWRMMDSEGWAPGMMGGRGMMGPGMMGMMMVMIDTDGDGALSLPEVQAVHTRMFNYIDANKDGKVTPEEIQSFFDGRKSGSAAK